jgi:DNA-binding transcriptional LysR family regulator
MHLRQLRAFIAVAEELSFTRAAARLNVSLQPLSFTIRRFEDEIGVVLFKRTTRRVELTDAGKVMLEQAHRIQDDMVEGVAAAQRAARGEFGRLTVGYVNTALFSSMPRTLRRYRERYPGVSLVLHEANSAVLERDVQKGELQSAFVHPQLYLPDVHYELLIRERRVCVVPSGHRLEGRRSVRLTELAKETFVSFARPSDHPVPDPNVAICKDAGFLPNIVQKADTSMAVMGLVSVGIGISLVPYCISMLRPGEVAAIPLVEDVPFDFAFISRRSDPSLEAQRLRDVAIEASESFVQEHAEVMSRG